jgi:hypothetical protein
MLLFTELMEGTSYITEANKEGVKEHYITGIFLQGNIKNRNGRLYPVDTLENEVKRYYSEIIENNRAYGELGHPQGPQINLDRVSHLITELHRDGDNFIGKAKILGTPMGNIALGLLEGGCNLGVSSRGMGSLKATKQGIMEVQNDFRLATAADIVADPSAPDAFVKGIMEGVEWFFDAARNSWVAQEQLHDTVKQLKQQKEISEEVKLLAMKNFFNSLAKS